MLRRISVRQATAYLLYLVTNATLFNLTKVQVLLFGFTASFKTQL